MSHPSDSVIENLSDIFESHALTEVDRSKVEELRQAAKAFAILIRTNAPHCKDQETAIHHVRQSLMFANAAIALNDEKGLCC